MVLLVAFLHFTAAPFDNVYILFSFLFGAVLLVFGMALFTLGADISMMTIGEKVGANLTKTRNLPLIVIVIFIIGFIITTAEPDLKVLADQISSIPTSTLTIAVSFGVGVFLVISFLRIFFQIRLSYILIFLYTVVFVLAFFTKEDFLAVSFDSGGVTTGPITVPFIMSLGAGLASVRGDSNSEEDSFGLVSLCSVGPILTVLILGMIYNPDGGSYSSDYTLNCASVYDVIMEFLKYIPGCLTEVAECVIPIVIFFVIFQLVSLKLHKKSVIKISIGLFYTYFGLVIFLTGVNVGFMPAGYFLGYSIASGEWIWVLVPFGAAAGYFIASAEPAVHVLKQQVEDMTEGAVTGKAMGISLSIGVAVSAAISMLRIIFGIPILYIVLPAYIIALIITFLVEPIFSAIAFDSGGVASGPMTAAFLIPFSIGACNAVEGDILLDAFGVVAMVAMTPVITIQILGIISIIKKKKVVSSLERDILIDDSIIDFDSKDNEMPNEK